MRTFLSLIIISSIALNCSCTKQANIEIADSKKTTQMILDSKELFDFREKTFILFGQIENNTSFYKALSSGTFKEAIKTLGSESEMIHLAKKMGASEKDIETLLAFNKSYYSLKAKFPRFNIERSQLKAYMTQGVTTVSRSKQRPMLVAQDACDKQYQIEKLDCQLQMALEAGVGVFSIFGGPLAAGAAALIIATDLVECLSQASLHYSQCKNQL